MSERPFRALWPSVRVQRRDLAAAAGAAIVSQAIGIPLALLVRWMIDRAQAGAIGPGLGALWAFGAALAALALLRGALHWHQGVRGERFAQSVLADVRGRLYEHLQRLSQGFFDRRPTGKILVRFVGDANALRTWLAQTLVTLPADVLTILGAGAVLAVMHVELLVAAALPLMLLVPVALWINPGARSWTREGRRSQTRLAGLLGERVPAMDVVKALNAQSADRAQVQEIIERVADAFVRRSRLESWTQAFSLTGATLALCGVAFWGIRLSLAGVATWGDLVAAVWLVLMLRGPVHRLSRANVVHQRARVAVERVAALLAREGEPGWSADLVPYTGPGRRVELSKLGYRGPGGRWAIRGLSAAIEGPGVVAITAEGGGVLLELLLRLRRPHEGRIRLDGQDVRRLRVADIRARMGWLDPDRHLVVLAVTLLREGDEAGWRQRLEEAWSSTQRLAPDAPPDRWRQLAEGPDDDELLAQVPADERLRLAVSCALLRDPPILLLDDPSRDLSGDQVAALLRWLEQVASHRLVLVVTKDARLVTAPAIARTIDTVRTATPEGDEAAAALVRSGGDRS